MDQDEISGKHRLVCGRVVSTDEWRFPDAGALSPEGLAAYLARKAGITLYLQGAPAKEVEVVAGVSLHQVAKLIRTRCLVTHADGLPYGWRGLVSYMRIEDYHRKTKVRMNRFGHGGVGAFKTILDQHPDLRKRFVKRILASPKGNALGPASRNAISHHAWLIKELQGLGYEIREEYPFNTNSRGYSSVWRFVKKVLDENPAAAAGVVGGPALEAKMKSGDGVDRPVLRVFQRVEMDAHKLDGIFCVLVPNDEGDYLPRIVHRLWVIVIIEVVSRVVLGYHFSMGKEVSKDDVLRAIRNALEPHVLRKITFSDTAYEPGAGFPSNVSDDLVGLCWDETSVDGAMAEVCPAVAAPLEAVVGSQLLHPKNSFSVRRTKDDRPFVEKFFSNIAGGGFQKLTNTTGAKPTGKNGRDPSKVALTSQFQIEYAEELLEVLTANYNVNVHSTLHRSPLDELQFRVRRLETPVRKAEASLVQSLLIVGKWCKVKGGLRTGKAPHINFYGATYHGDWLSNRHDLVGKELWVTSHLELDNRVAKAAASTGQTLGILRAAPPWHKLPHTLAIRKSINALLRRKRFALHENQDAIEGFISFVENNNRKLPVHPAYLELRRVLLQFGTRDIDQSMLDAALREQSHARADEVAKGPGAKGGNAPQRPPQSPSLPAPRKTVSR